MATQHWGHIKFKDDHKNQKEANAFATTDAAVAFQSTSGELNRRRVQAHRAGCVAQSNAVRCFFTSLMQRKKKLDVHASRMAAIHSCIQVPSD